MDYFSQHILEQILIIDPNTGHVARLEDDHVEYKAKLDWSNLDSKVTCIKELAGLSNKNENGGYLIYGIDDSTGKIIGSDKVDLADITNFLGNYFSPIFKISAKHHTTPFGLLFILHAQPYKDIPTVCKAQHPKLKAGTIYWRYNGKTEAINAHDLITLLTKLRNDSPVEKFLSNQNSVKKKDIMPNFKWVGGRGADMYGDNGFQCFFENIGKRARWYRVIVYKDSQSTLAPVSSVEAYLNTGEKHIVMGSYRRSQVPFTKSYHFRIYFYDDHNNLYYQEFSGSNGTINKDIVQPVETNEDEMNEFEQMNIISTNPGLIR